MRIGRSAYVVEQMFDRSVFPVVPLQLAIKPSLSGSLGEKSVLVTLVPPTHWNRILSEL